MGGHIFDTFMVRIITLDSLRLQAIKRLVVTQVTGQFGEAQYANQEWYHMEEDRPGAVGLHRNQGCPSGVYAFAA